jgi:hypothetical protein
VTVSHKPTSPSDPISHAFHSTKPNLPMNKSSIGA